MTLDNLEEFYDSDAAASIASKPLLAGKMGGEKISFIDEDDADDGDDPVEREEASSSNKLPMRKNGLISPVPMRRTVSLISPSSPSLSSKQQFARKKTVFKISLATVDDEDNVMMVEYGNRQKRSWLQAMLLERAATKLAPMDTCSNISRHQHKTSSPLDQWSSTLQKTTKHWPNKIWRDKFLREHNCRREELCKEVFLSAFPNLVILFVVSAYIVLGSLMFRHLDQHIAELPFHDVLLFAFTTITTIGYGNIVPRTPLARLACVAYCLVGIPLVFLPLSNLGELLADFYWVGVASLKGQKEGIVHQQVGPSRLPLKVVLLLILFHSLLGGLIFHFWIQQMPMFPAIYFSFISITTIGFGDLCPAPQCLYEALVIIVYLSCGIAIMSTLFNTLGDHLRRIHYLGRDFVGAPDVRVWFGGQPLTVRELVALVANRFEIPPQSTRNRLREVLAELDALIHLSDHGTTWTAPHFTAVPSPTATAAAAVGDDSAADADVQLQQPPVSPTSSINSEQQQLIQALSTLHRLTVKGTRTFHTPPTLNSLSLLLFRHSTSPNPSHNNNNENISSHS